MKNSSFSALFKRYRLRSEVDTLTQFGDLLAEEGFVYETSIFSRWQQGDRVPSDRKVLMAVLRVFIKRGGIRTTEEANTFLEAAEHGYMTPVELDYVVPIINAHA